MAIMYKVQLGGGAEMYVHISYYGYAEVYIHASSYRMCGRIYTR